MELGPPAASALPMASAAALRACDHDDLHELTALAHHRGVHTLGAVDGLEAEPALVAQPAPVHRVAVDALVAEQLVAAGLHSDAAPDRARRARALGLVEVPRPRLEAVGLRREGADRADLHGVPAEVRGERRVGERHHLRLVAPLHEVDERVPGHVLGEARAPVAQDATLTVEEDEVADGDGLLVVALLLDQPALARAPGHRLVLERALAALVAHGAVERVVDEEELEHPLLGLAHPVALGLDLHALADVDHAADAQGLDLDRCRCRPGTSGTCRPDPSARGSRSAGCRRRGAARRR